MNYILPLLLLFALPWWVSGSRWLNIKLREVHRAIFHELNDSHTVFSAETTERSEAEFVDDSVEADIKQIRRLRLFLIMAFVTALILLNVAQIA
ncbi:MAG: hypothetical protein OXU81_02520 [Gammaproteobacteria bacterium]|nr:hypothetical protein [Gammaproteobacteria bacterium]